MKNIFPFADSDSDFFNHSRIDDPNMTGSISARRYRPNVTFQKKNCIFSMLVLFTAATAVLPP